MSLVDQFYNVLLFVLLFINIFAQIIDKFTKRMKRKLLLLAHLTPSFCVAQNSRGTITNDIIFVIGGLVAVIVVLLLLRELFCWYWKINERVQNQEKIIRLLKIIADKEDKEDA